MNAAEIIESAFLEGMSLAITSEGQLHYSGQEEVVARLLPAIRENKTAILGELRRFNKPAPEVDHGYADVSFRWWRFRYLDGILKEASYCPPATQAEVLIGEPDAITAEAFQPLAPQPSAPLEEKDEAAILAWLGRIGETDKDTILDVLNSCRTNAEARKFFIR
ncbi:MAG: hypothetical protein ABI167_03420, partial [Nitrosospira sp.]